MRPASRFTLLALLCFCAQSCTAGKGGRGEFVGGRDHRRTADRAAVVITYLGTNGYLLESGETRILVDPYFSRLPVTAFAFNQPVEPAAKRIAWALRQLPGKIDGILVTHGHVDHLLDVPVIARATGALVVASPTSCFLAQAAGLAPAATVPVPPGRTVKIGNTTVRALTATHDRLFGQTLFPGVETAVPPRPVKAADWKMGEPLAFLIETGGKRIYLDSGGVPGGPLPEISGPVDLAIVGVALPDARKRLGPLLGRLRPRCFLPSHQDDFFRPLDDGFRFALLTDAGGVRRQWVEHGGAPERCFLLDYFQSWVLR